MYTQNKHRKTYTPEFKLQIINLYQSGERSLLKLSSEFNLNDRMLRR